MRTPFLAGSLGWLVVLMPAAVAACSASGASSGGPAPVDTETGTTVPGPGPDLGGSGDAGSDATAPTKPKNDCKLDALSGVTDVSAVFVTYAAPNAVPPAMTGGTLKGKYRVDKATVFLPSGTAGLADPKKSTGTINAWAIFDGTNYRLYLKAAFTISSVLGPQSQGIDTASQGAFAISGSSITLDHACDTALADEADYTYTDDGSGRATILIKTPTTYGDTFLQLDAAKD